MKGKVYLVGAGPGDAELLTLKAARLLRSADVVLHDDLVAPEVLSLISHAARVRNVGKRCGKKAFTQDQINALMIGYASAGLTVVRLKGGDPLIFGRAGEEIEVLHRAQIECEIVPGVTAALAAAAAAQVPLTDRRLASQLIFLTHHHCARNARAAWAPPPSDATLVVYMPGDSYRSIAIDLYSAGWSAATPCVIVSRAGRSAEQIHRTTLRELLDGPHLPAPSLLIIGAVAANWRQQASEGSPALEENEARA